MGIDEAREGVEAVAVHELCAVGRLEAVADLGDPPVADQQVRLGV